MTIRDTISDYISRLNLLDKNGKYIVAISGGADSVALMLLLIDLGYNVEAAHCNFHLRGKESDRDEQFVKTLCADCGIPFHIVHFDTLEYASLHKVSIEMAARNLRYAYFEQLRKDIDARAICVAHHRDDSVETLLINLIRGTGIHGLSGIQPVNGFIIRPLLCVSRQDIVGYLDSIGQPYVNDSTNFIDDVTRNKIRLNIIPRLKEINPSVCDCIQHTAERIVEATKVFDCAMAASIKAVTTHYGNTTLAVDTLKLKAQPSPEYVLYEILKGYGFFPSQIEQIYANINAPSGRMYSSQDFDLLIDRDNILLERHSEPIKPMKIPETGLYVYGDNKIRIEKQTIDSDFKLVRSSSVASLDASTVSFPLFIRPTSAGDRFIPFGMKGSKLISDYLTDKKKTVFDKRNQLVVTDASGEIMWLINERPDNRFRITEHSTEAIVISWE